MTRPLFICFNKRLFIERVYQRRPAVRTGAGTKAMLTDDERRTICNPYEIICPVCATTNVFHRLKRDICSPLDKEGDGHPQAWKWAKPGFEGIDPKQFFLGVCQRCHFTGELDDAQFRTSARDPDAYLEAFDRKALRQFRFASESGSGIAAELHRKIGPSALLMAGVATFHLGVYCQCLRSKISPGPIARYYLRLAWLYRDQELFYPRENIDEIGRVIGRIRPTWAAELPSREDYPEVPDLALNEAEALRLSRSFFLQNFEQLRQASVDDELRLRHLLGEVAYRLYELTLSEANFKTANSYFSGTMQKCLEVINDKRIVGAAVSRARQLLELCGDRGRQLRKLHDQGGGKATKKSASAKKAKAGAKAKEKKILLKKSAPAKKTIPAKKAVPGKAASRPAQADSQQQIDQLKARIAELEQENRRWRQLAGKDELTGLPNHLSLFTMALPQALKQMGPDGSLGLIAIGLEAVSRANHEHGWKVGDTMLRQAARSLRHVVRPGEQMFRLNGANFALLGKMDRSEAGRRAEDLQQRLGRAQVEAQGVKLSLASSLAVLVCDQVISSGPSEAAQAIHTALATAVYEAKSSNEGEIIVFQQTRF